MRLPEFMVISPEKASGFDAAKGVESSSMSGKERVDRLLVEKGLAETRQKAQGLIMAGKVFVDGKRIDKAGHRVPVDATIKILDSSPKYVSRGGLKLEAALDHFGIKVEGRVVMDVGASTGGFTDCLLQRGAKKVLAVDVGWGQLHPKLRGDPRVEIMERCNVRYLRGEDLKERPQLATIDVSFISLRLVIPVVARVLAPGEGEILALVKPQFEVGRKEVGKGGVVREWHLHERVLEEVRELGISLGFEVSPPFPSPIKGPKGNQEYFLWFRETRGS
jgi:23S rRNA (cytidine1920-2'-O)/16S rRNA (cytidine1409-2'-O)-methyltransferase